MFHKINELTFPEMGLGCVDLTNETKSLIHHAIDNGCYMFDTADCYGESERVLGKELSRYPREKLIICTKVGIIFESGEPKPIGNKEHIMTACQYSLNRLQTNFIDLLYLHRIDPNVPLEESMMAMKELVAKGMIRGIGLSEVTADQIRRAHKIHPVTAVQIEYSPWSRHDEYNGVCQTCKDLKIQIIAYSPIGRAMFADTDLFYFTHLPENDYRRMLPRYNNKELKQNLITRSKLEKFAKKNNVTLSQLVLAWEIEKGFIPIPGTTNIKHFDENQKALKIKLSRKQFAELEELMEESTYYGDRYLNEKQSAIYPEAHSSFLQQYKNPIMGAVGLGLLGFFAYKLMKNSSINTLELPADHQIPRIPFK